MPSAPFSSVLRFLRQVARPEGDSDDALLTRFIERGDEPAFEALVWRHGAMVLSVCQRIVRDPHLAEDGFQATFLVLARKASTIADRRCLASWLHGVAVRVSRKARGQDARRRSQLMALQSQPKSQVERPAGSDDVKPVLDEEIDRLPPRYRELVVLCYLQGKTNSEAARQLGCPEGTVFGRLARARRMLQTRLVRRGVTLSGAAVVAVLGPEAQASLSPALVAKATAVLAGSASASPTALTLAHEVMRTMLWTKAMKITVLTMVAGVVVASIASIGTTVPGSGRLMARATPLRADEDKKKEEDKPKAPTPTAEEAVARSLLFLARQQEKDGSWPGKGSEKIENTSLALLAMLGSGHTHRAQAVWVGYPKNIEVGLQYLLAKQDKAGSFDTNDLIAHAQATVAMCEAYGMTADPVLKGPAQRAINAIISAQQKSGGWIRAGKEETVDATAWQLAALKSASMAGLDVSAEKMAKAAEFLDLCVNDKLAAYANERTGAHAAAPKGKITPAATAMALRSRQLLGWGWNKPELVKSGDWLMKNLQSKDLDMPAQFFAVQVFHQLGGRGAAPDNAAQWNAKMRTALLESQDSGDKNAESKGSWGAGKADQRVKTTSCALLSLEVYFRHLPMFRKE
jgi:RNA polymerase sigma factor (sigma-70 family)